MSDTFLYVISVSPDGPVKLGMSIDPERRLGQLQTGHAERLKLYHMAPVPAEKARLYERLLHKTIAHKRKVGEWFDISVDEAIADIGYIFIQYDPSELHF